jgi:hypothetical protein
MFDNCEVLSNINMHVDSTRFLEIATKTLSTTTKPYIELEDAISTLFGGIDSDNDCYINFTDIIYTNNGIVKIDNDDYANLETIDSKTSLTSLNYAKLYADNKTYLNLSNITSVD